VRGGGAARQRRLGYPVITVPTLMIWGEADMALTIETTYGTEAQVSEFTLRYLPGISHWVQQDAPEDVNAMLTAFLQDLPVPEFQPED
ncbi:MAG: alpha/beta hydrolase, partial [Pseudomonadota bacterium]|nr:alpha/beta hydrolase [Pseudomonadota bacterium]